jgi:hypothetical protein
MKLVALRAQWPHNEDKMINGLVYAGAVVVGAVMLPLIAVAAILDGVMAVTGWFSPKKTSDDLS